MPNSILNKKKNQGTSLFKNSDNVKGTRRVPMDYARNPLDSKKENSDGLFQDDKAIGYYNKANTN